MCWFVSRNPKFSSEEALKLESKYFTPYTKDQIKKNHRKFSCFACVCLRGGKWSKREYVNKIKDSNAGDDRLAIWIAIKNCVQLILLVY